MLSIGAVEHVQMEFLPFGHAMGRDNFFYSCYLGGQFALFTRDMKHLFDELQLVRPTRVCLESCFSILIIVVQGSPRCMAQFA